MTVLRKLFTVLLASLALFLCVEGLAHLVRGGPVLDDGSVVPAEVGCFDPELGWALRPGARASSWATGREVEYRINADGWRGRALAPEKPPGTLRLVAVGDSRTFGYGVREEERFTELLAGWFRKLEVANLGVSGYGVGQELLMLRRQGWRYAPDVVVLYVAHFASERHMHTERFGKQKPRFVRVPEGLVLENVPVPAPPAGSELADPGALKLLHRWLRAHSSAYDFLRDQAVGLLAAQDSDAEAAGPSDAAVTELALEIVATMAEEARAHGAGFLLVSGVPELAELARARGLAVLEPGASLANPLLALPAGLGHLNPAGNGVLALELADALVDLGLVPAERRY